MPAPMVPPPMTAAVRTGAGLDALERGGARGGALGEEDVAERGGLGRGAQVEEGLALEGHRGVEVGLGGAAEAGERAEGRGFAAGAPS